MGAYSTCLPTCLHYIPLRLTIFPGPRGGPHCSPPADPWVSHRVGGECTEKGDSVELWFVMEKDEEAFPLSAVVSMTRFNC